MRWRNILYNTGFAITCLLAYLLIFESELHVPLWLQVFGRVHPLFLHLPIGLLLLYAIVELLSYGSLKTMVADELKDGLLVLSFVTVAITSLMGLFLSREEGYADTGIAAHKWWGSALCFFLLIWWQVRHRIRKNRTANAFVSIAGIIAISVTGHLGGSVTHGDDFVFAPIEKKQKPIAVKFEEAVVFRDMVQPILQDKCIGCHNEKKAKGELIMETRELLLKGGKNGKLWDSTSNDVGLLLKRVHLPLNNDDHMPPSGKPQLSDMELTILESWIKTGADFTKKVAALLKTDTLRTIATVLFKSDDNEEYNFAKADDKVLKSLNNFYRVVQPVAENSPGLNVRYFNAASFNDTALKQIEVVKQQVVNIDLSRMPVKDQQLAELSKFPNLRNVNLSFTPINGEGLRSLQQLKQLKELSLSGTAVTPEHLETLSSIPSLKKVFVWNTRVTSEDIKKLKTKTAKISYETGYNGGDTLILKLTTPMVQNDQFVISEPTELKLKHNINGVSIRYTLDGQDPDSIRSSPYQPGIIVDKNLVLKTKAFRKGWISSDVETTRFYVSKSKPDSIFLETRPNDLLTGSGAQTLNDGQLGTGTLSAGDWLGFHAPNKFGCTMTFEKEKTASSIILTSYLQKDSRFLPPRTISIWTGLTRDKMKKVATLTPEQPRKDFKEGNTDYEVRIPKTPFKFIRIETEPLSHLPSSYGKSDKTAWMIFDEIVIR